MVLLIKISVCDNVLLYGHFKWKVVDLSLVPNVFRDEKTKQNQRTNGPVNAHLRSAAYTNKRLNIMVFNSSAGADKPLGHFLFSESSIFCPFANFLLAFSFK